MRNIKLRQRGRTEQSVLFDQCYWAEPGKLMAGCYLGSHNKENARENLKGLLECGIRHIVNLMESDEISSSLSYEDQMRSLIESQGEAITFNRMPIRDMGIPSGDEMRGILDDIEQHIEENKPVYVHCLGGTGRTGTVVGCYLARRGYASGKKIFSVIRELRKNTRDHGTASPETLQQMNFVLSWIQGE